MHLSVVSTLYQSAIFIDEFYERVVRSASQVAGENFEIVLVNDGSTDSSLVVATALVKRDRRVTLIDLSRNFGHHHAIMVGLEASDGKKVFLIDSDLEEHPEWLPSFAAVMEDQESDSVFGVQESRRGSFFEVWSGKIYYKLFRLLSKVDQPDNIVTARLMTRRYVDSILRFKESELNIGAIFSFAGFKQTAIPVPKSRRRHTSYSFTKKFGHFITAITSFSNAPLVATFFSGLVLGLTGLVFSLYIVLQKIFFSSPPDGYTTLIASIWTLAGITIASLGLQGIYIGKIFSEVKNRPNTIVRKVYKQEDPGIDSD
jgi:putative glycosyltransferase